MRVAIVGAGVAGLSAGRALVNAGHDIVIFERASKPGGRVATRFIPNVELPRMGTVDLAFDHGAQYFTVRDPRFKTVVDEWLDQRFVARWTGRIVAFDDEGWEEIEGGTERYVAVPSMSALGRHLANGLDVQCHVRVAAVEQIPSPDHRWQLRAQDDRVVGEFDRVILALPPQPARTLAGAGRFDPLFAAVVMKPCWTTLAAFEESVTPRFDAAFVSGSPLGWIARNNSKPKRDRVTETWVLQATMEWSAAHAGDRPDVVGPFLLEAFADLIRAGLPRPFFLSAHRWREAVADPPLSIGALHDGGLGLSVCGDWCAGSRIEDAFVSGLTAANFLTSSC